jgi:transposase
LPLAALLLYRKSKQAEAEPQKEEPTLETVSYQRKKQKGQREAKLDQLPVETVEYHLSEAEQVCPCCQGALHQMSKEIRKELKMIPAQVKVVEHVRHVYSCRHTLMA